VSGLNQSEKLKEERRKVEISLDKNQQPIHVGGTKCKVKSLGQSGKLPVFQILPQVAQNFPQIPWEKITPGKIGELAKPRQNTEGENRHQYLQSRLITSLLTVISLLGRGLW
jgi:hypothetical protein